jgi:hypothetical protein
MSSPHAHTNEQLLHFNQQMLGQALKLVAAHGGLGRPRYEGLAGSHLRHVIEHYRALVFPSVKGVVDYDQRKRERDLEVNPASATALLLALQQALQTWPAGCLDTAVCVKGQGGTGGEFEFSVMSSLGRELAFVASHTVHHFALLLDYCQQHFISTPTHFGKAPSTVAHENAGPPQQSVPGCAAKSHPSERAEPLPRTHPTAHSALVSPVNARGLINLPNTHAFKEFSCPMPLLST